jgi:antitoxin (DNA-binding transcriptional repressor) of toxin-antitoxin stability system
MPTIASRDLRNHTAAVLDGVRRGEVYIVTSHGEPVAELRRPGRRRRETIPREEVVALLSRQGPDPRLESDMTWISEGGTDELDPLR